MSKFLRAACCVASLFAISLLASGQVSTATAFGDVTDSTGAEIPGATLVFTQTLTTAPQVTSAAQAYGFKQCSQVVSALHA